MADGIVLRASGEAEWAGTHRGKEAVVEYLLELGEAFPDQTVEVIDSLVSETGSPASCRVAIGRDGRVGL